MLRVKSMNFKGLVFIPNTDITVLGFKIERKITNQCLGGLRMEDQGVQSPEAFLVKNISVFQPSQKHDNRCAFK